VIHDAAAVIERVRRMLDHGEVVTYSEKPLKMQPRSILLHGDTPGALDLAKAIRQEIELSGSRIVPVSRLLEEAADRIKA
jgi:UPF0271 protein